MRIANLPYIYAADPTKGRPIFNGSIYIGQPDLDPSIPANQIAVSGQQESGAIVALAQPIETGAGGVPLYNGSPVVLIIDQSPFSILVNDNIGSQKYYQARANSFEIPISDTETSLTVDTLKGASNSLETLTGMSHGQVVSTKGYWDIGDGGHGTYRYDSSSSAAVNGGTVINAAGGAGRWLLLVGSNSDAEQWGVYSDETTDSSTSIATALNSGIKINFSRRDYVYESTTNPVLTNGLGIDGSVFVGKEYRDTLKFNRDNFNLVGLHHNHQEDTNTKLGTNGAITSGVILPPPISTATINSRVDVIAHWYQDFGLEYTRDGNGSNGSLTWYYWTWAHYSGSAYDAQRHPWMGWYRGDDANVLDWQCYWMREAGVKAVTLVPSSDIDVSTWNDSTDKYYWLYQLFNNAPNFKGLKYIMWGKYTGSAAAIQAQWEYVIDNIYAPYNNFYCVEKNGYLYPAFYVFEGANLFSNLGGTQAQFLTFCQSIKAKFVALGYKGVAILLRHPNSNVSIDRKVFEDSDIMVFSCDYAGHGAWLDTGSNTIPNHDAVSSYSDLVDSWEPTYGKPNWTISTSYAVNDVITYKRWIWMCTSAHTSSADDTPGEGKSQSTHWRKMGPCDRDIASIPLSKYAVSPHPSAGSTYFGAAGTTPELFRKLLSKAIDYAITKGGAPMVCLYNVSEWAEGGPGLQPNMADGFGYLDAVRDCLTYQSEKALPYWAQPETDYVKNQFVAATSTISAEPKSLRLSTDAARTMTSTPTIAAGVDGQILRITNINTNTSHTVTFQDNATLANSNLFLTATTVAIAPYDTIIFEYISGKGWVQIGFTNVL